jgi:hypothetical protein
MNQRLVPLAAVLGVAFMASGAPACGSRPANAPAAPSVVAQQPPAAPALASGCFGWPGTEFSPSNKAAVRTHLGAGDRAVEFSLRDTAGAAVTLSGLLATRPVLIVHGAFT